MIYKKNIQKQVYLWLKRIRYRKGYRIQSPQIYYFAREVILQPALYYEFSQLKQRYGETASKECKWLLPRKRYELLFRIANDMQAEQIIEIGTKNAMGTTYMKAARKKAESIIINEEAIDRKFLSGKIEEGRPAFIQKTGYLEAILPKILSQTSNKGRRLIVYNSEFFSNKQTTGQIERILQEAQQEDCLVISGLQLSKNLRNQWKEWVRHPLVTASFDLHEAGILFFKPSFHQKCYLINYQ